MAYTARGDLNTRNPKILKGREGKKKREKEEARKERLKEEKREGRSLNYKPRTLTNRREHRGRR